MEDILQYMTCSVSKRLTRPPAATKPFCELWFALRNEE
jgi:hypothetical protein